MPVFRIFRNISHMRKSLFIFTGLLAFALLMRSSNLLISKEGFHSPEELRFLQTHFRPPLDSGEYFSLPQNCKGCHGYDSLGLANIDGSGMDINLFDDWETSMMGLSAHDPLWRAKVSHEILVNPGHANELQNLCTSCHAPLGHYDAFYKGQPHYTLADLQTDSLGQSGVSCHSCHGIKDSSSLGSLFTGFIPYDTNRMVYGPFPAPLTGPMQLYVGLTPALGPHLSESKACSPCHTLITQTTDLSGTPTGTTYVEQATYHEYLNSAYPSILQQSCQSCHMPEIEDAVKIANGYTAIPGRTPFNLHSFAGANQFMVQLIRQNKSRLGVDAPDRNFDSTLAAITKLLREQTLQLDAAFDTLASTADTAVVRVNLVNKAGHKFPSGYPSRRAVLQVIARKANGDTLFASGLFDSTFEISSLASAYEPHYEVINSPTQTQVYEQIMGDVNGNRTTVLERAASSLKDNRLPPLGFTTLHPTYDTCSIAGGAFNDPDFNRDGTMEGTGADVVRYHIPLQGYFGALQIITNIYYQAVPPGWLSEMRNYNSAEIDTFLTMYDQSDRTPFLVASDTVQTNPITTGPGQALSLSTLRIGPNPTHDGRISIIGLPSGVKISVYDATGRRVFNAECRTPERFIIQLPESTGIYYLVASINDQRMLRKIVRY
jgi:hypothetical protein